MRPNMVHRVRLRAKLVEQKLFSNSRVLTTLGPLTRKPCLDRRTPCPHKMKKRQKSRFVLKVDDAKHEC